MAVSGDAADAPQSPATDSVPEAPPAGAHKCAVTLTVKPACAPSASAPTGYAPKNRVSGTTEVMTADAGATAVMYTLFQIPELNVKELPNTVSLRDS